MQRTHCARAYDEVLLKAKTTDCFALLLISDLIMACPLLVMYMYKFIVVFQSSNYKPITLEHAGHNQKGLVLRELCWEKEKKSEPRTAFERITFSTLVWCSSLLSYCPLWETHGERGHLLGSFVTCVLHTARISNANSRTKKVCKCELANCWKSWQDWEIVLFVSNVLPREVMPTVASRPRTQQLG